MVPNHIAHLVDTATNTSFNTMALNPLNYTTTNVTDIFQLQNITTIYSSPTTKESVTITSNFFDIYTFTETPILVVEPIIVPVSLTPDPTESPTIPGDNDTQKVFMPLNLFVIIIVLVIVLIVIISSNLILNTVVIIMRIRRKRTTYTYESLERDHDYKAPETKRIISQFSFGSSKKASLNTIHFNEQVFNVNSETLDYKSRFQYPSMKDLTDLDNDVDSDSISVFVFDNRSQCREQPWLDTILHDIGKKLPVNSTLSVNRSSCEAVSTTDYNYPSSICSSSFSNRKSVSFLGYNPFNRANPTNASLKRMESEYRSSDSLSFMLNDTITILKHNVDRFIDNEECVVKRAILIDEGKIMKRRA
jgi:hypothetical protein